MPVNAFNGTHNWGYDGVLWYAVHEPYGGPAALPALRRRLPRRRARRDPGRRLQPPRPVGQLPARVRALPEGQGANTWGDLVNLDGEGSAEVRRYILDNARMWLADYHVDGLRLDAVHALADDSEPHLLEEMAIEVAALSAHLRRPLTLIAESDLNDPRAGHAARGRRLRARRAVERRLPPRPARRADRRDARLLRRLRAAGRAGQGVRARVLPRRHLLVVPRARPRRADRHRGDADLAARGLQPEPRPGRQPRGRRPDHRGTSTTTSSRAPRCSRWPARSRRCCSRARSGRRRRRSSSSPPTPRRSWAGHRRGPDRGVRAAWAGTRRRTRPAGPGDLRALEAGLVGARVRARHARVLAVYRGWLELRRDAARADRPVVRARRLHGRRGGAVVHDAARRRCWCW